MKRNAIARIILYSIIAVVLSGLLLGGLAKDFWGIHLGIGGTTVEGEVTFESSVIENIEIDWAAGSVLIKAADTDSITVSEVAPENSKYKMTYQISDNHTLKLDYASGTFSIGFGNWSLPSKDLIITVPQDWICGELEIDGAALEIQVDGFEIQKIDLDGAGISLRFNGTFQELNCDGAGCKLELTSFCCPTAIDLDGAGCELALVLPFRAGFQVDTDGLGCSFQSDLPYSVNDGCYIYGDKQCKINVSGLGCSVTIEEAALGSNAYAIICANDFTAEMLMEPLADQYTPGTIVKLKTDVLLDSDLELYVDGQFICKQTEAFESDGKNYWAFYFTMPDHNVTIEMKTSGGLLPE